MDVTLPILTIVKHKIYRQLGRQADVARTPPRAGTSASFQVNAAGTVTVTFTTTATDCMDNQIDGSSASVSFAVLLNQTVACVNTPPNGGSGIYAEGGPQHGSKDVYSPGGGSWSHYTYNGTLSDTTYTYTYVKDSDYRSDCGPHGSPLPSTATLPAWSIHAGVGLSVIPGLDPFFYVDDQNLTPSFPIFGGGGEPGPGTKLYGTTWDRKTQYYAPTFTGSYCWSISATGPGGTVVSNGCNYNYSGLAGWLGSAPGLPVTDGLASADCSVPCCPDN